jgi:DNA replication protein DnaC
MDIQYHLSTNLKRLRLPGILENLDIRVQEAKENDLGYVEFLSLLVQDEVFNREANMLAKKLKIGGFSPRLTFESFDFRFNSEALASQTIRDLATCHFIEQHRNVALCGPPGIGKTHIAHAIGHEVCRRGKDALFSKTHKLLLDLTDVNYPRRAARLWKRVQSVDLLILDDFAFRRYETREAELLYSLADERLTNASTVLTSNRPTEDWYGVFPDPVIGGAILDRFVSGAIKIVVEKAKSYRKHGIHDRKNA